MSARKWTVTIPAPASWLNANGRRDRRRETPDRRAWRAAAQQWARSARLPGLGRAHIIAELCFTDNRRRDPHNYYPTLKACIDGLIDYGLLPDDSSEYLTGPDVRMGQPIARKPYGPTGQVVLTITEMTSELPHVD